MEFFRKSLDPVIALSAIAILDVFLFLQVGAWTVGGGETMMTGLIAEFFIGDAIGQIPFWQLVFQPDASYWKIYISLGMLFGAIVGAVLAELSLSLLSRIDTDLESLFLIDATETRDPTMDTILKEIAE